MKQKSASSRPTLHELLGALSLWGATSRMLLFAFMAALLAMLRVAGSSGDIGAESIAGEVMLFTLVVSTFVVLDAGYVVISRVLPFARWVDLLVLLATEIALALLYLVPQIAYTSVDLRMFIVWLPVVTLMVLAMRLLLGYLGSTKRR
jgi:hypothetical protein